MEEPKKNTHKEEKKKMAIKIGGGGGGGVIGGVILLGGALVTATLVSAFAIKRIRRRRSTDNHQTPPATSITPPNELKLEEEDENNNNDEERKGLHFLLPDSSPPITHNHPSNGTAKVGVTQIESTSLISAQILILDEKPKLQTNGVPNCGNEEILLSDIPKNPESSPLFDGSAIMSTEEFSSLPVFDCPLLSKPNEYLKKNESSKEEIGIVKDDEAIVAALTDQITPEDSPQTLLHIEVLEAAHTDWMQVINEEHETPKGGDQEITCSNDCSILESIAFGNNAVNKQEFSLLSVFESESLLQTAENMNKNDPRGRPLFIEAGQAMKGDDTIEAAQGHAVAAENCASLFKPENVNQSDGTTERALSVEAVQAMKGDEAIDVVEGDQIDVEDSPLLFNPENLNEDNHTEGPLFGEAVQAMKGNEVIEVDDGDQTSVQGNPLLLKPESLNNDDYTERPLPREAVQAMKGEEAVKATRGDQVAVEDNPQMQLTEEQQKEEEYDDDVEDFIVKKCEATAVETADADQIAVEDDQQIQLSEEQETLVNVEEEAFCSDSSPLKKIGIYVQEFSRPVFDSPLLSKPGNMNKNASTEAPMAIEAVKVMKENGAIEAACADQIQIAVEDKPPIQSIEKEQKEDYHDNDGDGRENLVAKRAVETVQDDMVTVDYNPQMQLSEVEEEDEEQEDIAEKVEESSEGTGDSSMESNAEAIWPAELMQKLSQELKELKINKQKIGENIEKDRKASSEEDVSHNRIENGTINTDYQDISEDDDKLATTFSQRYVTELDTQNNQPTNVWKLRIWIWSMLVPLWCLFYWHFGLPFVKLCLIVVLILILSKFHVV